MWLLLCLWDPIPCSPMGSQYLRMPSHQHTTVRYMKFFYIEINHQRGETKRTTTRSSCDYKQANLQRPVRHPCGDACPESIKPVYPECQTWFTAQACKGRPWRAGEPSSQSTYHTALSSECLHIHSLDLLHRPTRHTVISHMRQSSAKVNRGPSTSPQHVKSAPTAWC